MMSSNLTWPATVNSMMSSNLSGHFALYARCDHSLWAPAVIQNPEAYTTMNAGKQQKKNSYVIELYVTIKNGYVIEFYVAIKQPSH